jgi:hypothetical protein
MNPLINPFDKARRELQELIGKLMLTADEKGDAIKGPTIGAFLGCEVVMFLVEGVATRDRPNSKERIEDIMSNYMDAQEKCSTANSVRITGQALIELAELVMDQIGEDYD